MAGSRLQSSESSLSASEPKLLSTSQPQLRVAPQVTPLEPKSRIALFVLAAFFLVFAAGEFVFRDLRNTEYHYPVNDLTTPWISSVLFTQGKNPYNDTGEFARIWAATGVPPRLPFTDYRYILSVYPRVYPPTTLLLMSPLAFLQWPSVVRIYLAGSTLLLVSMLFLMARNLPYTWDDPRRLYFVAFALVMHAFHYGIATVNLSTLVIAFLCASVGFLSTRPYLSGTAIAIAMCLKPQLAIGFFVYPWLRKKWKTAFAALAVCALITIISFTWLAIHHIDWFHAWRVEMSRCSLCSPFTPGPRRLTFLNLQTLAFEFTKSPEWSNLLSSALFVLLAGVSIVLILRHVSDKNESAGIAIISILTLLPFYQNGYNGAILLFVLYWAIANWATRGAKAALLGMLLLLPPVFTLRIGRMIVRYDLNSNLLWNGFIELRAIWFELFLLLVLLIALYKTPRAFKPLASPKAAG